jgi:hypothetical protein
MEPKGGPAFGVAVPANTRKNWYGVGKLMQYVVTKSVAVIVGEMVDQAGSNILVLPCT